MTDYTYTLLIPLIPLVFFLFIGLTGHKMKPIVSGLIGTMGLGIGAILSYITAFNYFILNHAAEAGYHSIKAFDITWLHLTDKLTINLGLRYEFYPLINRGDRGIERWDPATNTVYMGGVGNVPWDNGITVSKKLLAPRIGIAYRIDDKTVIRSGYGMSFDPIPFGRPMRGQYPSTITATFQNPETYGYYNSISVGIPKIPVPDISTGIITLPPTVDMGPRSPNAGLLHRGYIESWNLTLERKLPMNFVTSMAYVGTQTVHQLLDLDIVHCAADRLVTHRTVVTTLQNIR